MIEYRTNADGLAPGQLHDGFFDGWWNAPDPATHLRILEGSGVVVVAIDSEIDQVVGFITALTDGVLYAQITLLEVAPGHKGLGIGSELVARATQELGALYRIDVACDDDVVPFYERLEYMANGGQLVSRVNRLYQPGRSINGGPELARAGTEH